jgi:hypothetical protein
VAVNVQVEVGVLQDKVRAMLLAFPLAVNFPVRRQLLLAKWLKIRPESGLDCLICAEFARQRLLAFPLAVNFPVRSSSSSLLLP